MQVVSSLEVPLRWRDGPAANGGLAHTLLLFEQRHLDTLAQMAVRASTTTRWKSPSGRHVWHWWEWQECGLGLMRLRSSRSLDRVASRHGRWDTEEAWVRAELNAENLWGSGHVPHTQIFEQVLEF
ncbi:hypothetical protein F2Q68_00006740 [Brassica cretica]|uniref:Uncharacterized protein n=1 Tax=Brassica cretica TaxID=69181 RepID=A0A8S9JMV6_BRACR|nr:hypothetical protein F2Q68_00006740 [Brassica cretica]